MTGLPPLPFLGENDNLKKVNTVAANGKTYRRVPTCTDMGIPIFSNAEFRSDEMQPVYAAKTELLAAVREVLGNDSAFYWFLQEPETGRERVCGRLGLGAVYARYRDLHDGLAQDEEKEKQ